MSEKTKVITCGNFKGGTGKTTNSGMIAYTLAKMGYKVLVSDQDPQANITDLYLTTKSHLEQKDATFNRSLMKAIEEEDLRSIVTPIMENLYLLPSYDDFADYPSYLEGLFKKKADRVKYFASLLNTIKDEYDFVFIDVPPTESIITDSALYASDYIIIVMQTQERSYKGALKFTRYLQKLINEYDAEFDILGILPVLLKNKAPVDNAILTKASEYFGEDNMFDEIVTNLERLKRYDITGIRDGEDMHDKTVADLYQRITNEFLERLGMEPKELAATVTEGVNQNER